MTTWVPSAFETKEEVEVLITQWVRFSNGKASVCACRRSWKAEHKIEGPSENDGIDEEECQKAKIRQERA